MARSAFGGTYGACALNKVREATFHTVRDGWWNPHQQFESTPACCLSFLIGQRAMKRGRCPRQSDTTTQP